MIRVINMSTGAVSTLAGDGSRGLWDGIGTSASFYDPTDVAMDAAGAVVFVCDYADFAIRQINVSSALVTTIAGQTTSGYSDGIGGAAMFRWPQGIGVDAAGTVALVVRRVVFPLWSA